MTDNGDDICRLSSQLQVSTTSLGTTNIKYNKQFQTGMALQAPTKEHKTEQIDVRNRLKDNKESLTTAE